MNIGIAIGLPFGRKTIHPMWAASFYVLDFPQNTAKSLLMVQNRPVDEARNTIVDMALQQKAEYLFFIDDDVICPKYTVLALGNILEKQKDEGVMVATGIYCTKNFSPSPVIYKDGVSGNYWDWEVNQEFEVDACGAGCMLVNMKVFENLKKPYFQFTQEYKPLPDGDQILNVVSEDVNFCRQVRNAGFKIMAHGAVLCQHYNQADDTFYELPKDSRPFKKELKRQQEEKLVQEV